MSSNRDYYYEDYVPELKRTKITPKLKAIPKKKTTKKISITKILALMLILYFVCIPATQKLYNYTFINYFKNSNIKASAL